MKQFCKKKKIIKILSKMTLNVSNRGLMGLGIFYRTKSEINFIIKLKYLNLG